MRMTPSCPIKTKTITINPRRPSIFNDVDRASWKSFQDIVKNSTIPIWVNAMFDFIENIIAKNESYGGGGFNYMFWFQSEADRINFMIEIENIWPKFSEPWMYPDAEQVLVKTEHMEDLGGYDKKFYIYTSKIHDQVVALRA